MIESFFRAGETAAQAQPDQLEGAQRELASAVSERQDSWTDICREPAPMQVASPEVLVLYRGHGCRFVAPTPGQAQEILDALDAAILVWDRDYPPLFYPALDVSFPGLKKERSSAQFFIRRGAWESAKVGVGLHP
jgi:hypothetical protein